MDQQQAKCPPQRSTQHFLRLCSLLTSGRLPPAAAAQPSPIPAGGSAGRETDSLKLCSQHPSQRNLSSVYSSSSRHSLPHLCLLVTKTLNSNTRLPLLSAETPNLYTLIMYHSCPVPSARLIVNLIKSKITLEVGT